MGRALLLVMDSFGIGAAEDAEHYGDAGADTLGHIAAACAAGRAGENEHRTGPLRLPVLASLGLGVAAQAATGTLPPGLEGGVAEALWGYAAEVSKGKDTPSGHWEIAGYPVPFDWGYFPKEVPCFPARLIAAIVKEAELPGVLGQRHASGTQIIAELGAESIETGKPIFYTSTDSVLQIAAHEEAFGLERLLSLCEIARRHVDHLNIGRVIARPFVGDAVGGFTRTANRRDYAVPPPADTLLDVAERAGRGVITIGKIGDIFAHRGTGESVKGPSNDALIDRTLEAMGRLPEGGLLFANYVDFDTLYGHRRDIPGYAGALEQFDMRLPQILSRLGEDDLLIITADHGCDPSWTGTDHTREFVPVLARLGKRTGPIGRRDSFADMAASVAEHLRLDWQGPGSRFCSSGCAGILPIGANVAARGAGSVEIDPPIWCHHPKLAPMGILDAWLLLEGRRPGRGEKRAGCLRTRRPAHLFSTMIPDGATNSRRVNAGAPATLSS